MKIYLLQVISAGDASSCSLNVIDAGATTEHLIVNVWHTGDPKHTEYKFVVGGSHTAYNRAMKNIRP